MSQAAEQIARQFANANANRVVWADIRTNLLLYATGDGVVDDSTNIQTALDAAATRSVKIVDGSGKTYKINSSITIPPGVILENLNLVAGTAGMNMVLVKNGSALRNAKLTGTGTVSTVERGVYPALEGVTDVRIENVEVTNLTFGVHAQYLTTYSAANVPKRWHIDVYAHDIVGTTGTSEGYGVLLSPAEDCTVNLKAKNIKRHALYLSAGAKYNDCSVDVDTCYNAAVQIYSMSSQEESSYNRVKLNARNISNPSGQASQAIGVAIIQKANYNHISINMLGGGTADYAVTVEGEQTAGAPIPRGNHVHDCSITGQFIGQEVIRLQNTDSTQVYDNKIDAYGTFAVMSIRIAGTPDAPQHGPYIYDNRINAQGQAIRGIYNELSAAFSFIGLNDIRNNGAGTRVDATTAGTKRKGYSREFMGQQVINTVGATSSLSTAVSFPEGLENGRVQTNVVSQSVTNANSNSFASGVTASQFTLHAYNAHSAAQNITVDWVARGD